MPTGGVGRARFFHKQLVIEQINSSAAQDHCGHFRKIGVQTEFTQIWIRLPNPQITVELARAARCRITMKIRCGLSNIPLDRRRDTFQPCGRNQVP